MSTEKNTKNSLGDKLPSTSTIKSVFTTAMIGAGVLATSTLLASATGGLSLTADAAAAAGSAVAASPTVAVTPTTMAGTVAQGFAHNLTGAASFISTDAVTNFASTLTAG